MELLNATNLDRKSGSTYRGRLAPSPTGYLHLGHARTFWIAQQRALAARGTLILRDEDLDPERSQPHFRHAMIEDLRWLGLEWQEGPDVGGPFGRTPKASGTVSTATPGAVCLPAAGSTPAAAPARTLPLAMQAPHDDEGIYPGTCRPATAQTRRDDTPSGANWRFRVPEGEAIEFQDGHFGPQQFVAGQDFGDFLVWRRDDLPVVSACGGGG